MTWRSEFRLTGTIFTISGTILKKNIHHVATVVLDHRFQTDIDKKFTTDVSFVFVSTCFSVVSHSYQSYQIQGDRRLQSESNRRFRGPRIFKTLVREVIALRPWRI